MAAAVASQSGADRSYRVLLPADVVPERYDLTLEPDVERFTFEGVVRIACDVQVATDVVELHARDLLIGSAKFTPAGGGRALVACELGLRPKDTTLALRFEEVLPVGRGELEISFHGTLNDQMAGFYRSQYTDAKGVKRYMATTQFEAIDARRCFPCWDEPARKAVFVVTMVYPANLTAVSNMPQSRTEIQADGRRRDVFMPTPKMSTYLLAFCVGEFEYVSGQTRDGVIARIMCCAGNASKCTYALSCCIKALDFYNDFFGIPYPLPKMDMIAIPEFSAGAMENWGLVTYREVCLLCDEKAVSAVQKQRICTVITHELAHQWFGNLVTMAWWDDLWLNEGFANWMQTFAADSLHPEWHIWESYVGTEQQRALQLDALRSSHPIQVPIGKAQEVEEVFDAVSYCKGGSIVRMIYAVLGQDSFQQGLKLYFARHKYGNTETKDLWQAWAEASGKPLPQMMGSWTEKMGFPVVKVLSDPLEAGSEAAEVECEQSWFLADGSQREGDEDKLWFVPMLIATDKGVAPVAFQEQKRARLPCGTVTPGASWLKLNFGQHMPLRVLYPASMISRLAANMPSLPAEDRIGLLTDTYALCKAGALAPELLVRLFGGFRQELNDKVWAQLSQCFDGLDRIVRMGLEPHVVTAFCGLAASLVRPAFAGVGWDAADTDDDNRKVLRTALATAVAKYCDTDAEVCAEAQRRCNAFIAAPSDTAVLSADVRTAVLTLAMQAEGCEATFDQLVKVHNAIDDGAVKQSIYQALGKSASSTLRKRGLEWALGHEVRAQDLIYLPMAVSNSGREGAEEVFEWVQKDYDRIYGRLGETSMMLFQNIVRISGAGFVTTEKAEAVRQFWESKSVIEAVSKSLGQTIEAIEANGKFVERLRNSRFADKEFWAEMGTGTQETDEK